MVNRISNRTSGVIFLTSCLFLYCGSGFAQSAVLAIPDKYAVFPSVKASISIAPSKNRNINHGVSAMPLPLSKQNGVNKANSTSSQSSTAAGVRANEILGTDFEVLPIDRPRGAWRQVDKTPGLVTTSNTVLTANFIVEADYSLYQYFGNNEAAVRTYVTNLFLAVSAIYEADIKVKIVPSAIRVWTKPDPWVNQIDTATTLQKLREYWGKNHKTVPRAGVVLLSKRNLGGGRATLNGLCADTALTATKDIAYGAAVMGNLDGVIATTPGANTWDVVVTAHEIGHNFNSDHTHCTARVNSVGFYDQCYVSGASSCFAGTAVAGNGTIMSYCHVAGTNGMAAINPLHFVDATGDPAHTNVMRATAEEYTIGNNVEGCLVPN
jgi:Metallo-peptidase family M12